MMMHFNIQPFIDWLQLHPHHTGAVVFTIALLESLAVIGSLVPGSVLMTAIGGLIGLSVIPLLSTILWAVLGAIVGDGLSFFAGYYYHDKLRDTWLFRRYPYLLQKSETFFKQHGGKSIFLGRFLGPIRAFVPAIAGMMRFNVKRYAVLNVSSACCWAPVYLLPGFLLGAASQALPPKVAMRFMLWTMVVLCVLCCIGWLLRRLCCAVVGLWWYAIARLHSTLEQSRYRVYWQRYLTNHDASLNPHHQLTLISLFVLYTVLLVCAGYSASHHGWITYLNLPVWHVLHNLYYDRLETLFILITMAGEVRVILGMACVVFVYLCWRRCWINAIYWLLATCGTCVLVELLKQGLHTDRPHLGVLLRGYSFPSGHTCLSIVLFGFLSVMLAYQQPSQRLRYYTVAGILIALVSFSRLYLGVHWLSDVIGSVLLAASVLTVLIFSWRYHPKDPIAPHLYAVFWLGLVLSYAAYFATHYPRYLHRYHFSYVEKQIDDDAWWQQNLSTVPLRLNRIGRPVEIFNLQWAAPLESIKQDLLRSGWQEPLPSTLMSSLTRLGLNAERNVTQPLFEPRHLRQTPALVLVKAKLPTLPQNWLVIRLWNNYQRLQKRNIPLWIGTVNYGYTPNKQWLSYGQQLSRDILPAPLVLSTELTHWQWRKVDATAMHQNQAIHRYILLVKPKDAQPLALASAKNKYV